MLGMAPPIRSTGVWSMSHLSMGLVAPWLATAEAENDSPFLCVVTHSTPSSAERRREEDLR